MSFLSKKQKFNPTLVHAAPQGARDYIWEAGDMKEGKLLVPTEDGGLKLVEPPPVRMMKFGVLKACGDLRAFKPFCLPSVKPVGIRLARSSEPFRSWNHILVGGFKPHCRGPQKDCKESGAEDEVACEEARGAEDLGHGESLGFRRRFSSALRVLRRHGQGQPWLSIRRRTWPLRSGTTINTRLPCATTFPLSSGRRCASCR